jgi:hypothetical protein
VNIAAYMAALDIWDLDRTAKHAVQVIAGRASRYTGAATVPIGRLAVDMGVCYNVARLALARAVEAGYLTVDKPPGLPPTWTLTSRADARPTSRVDAGDLARRSATGSRAGSRTMESLDTYKESAGSVARHPATARRAGEKPVRGPYDHFPDWTAEARRAALAVYENGEEPQ